MIGIFKAYHQNWQFKGLVECYGQSRMK